MIKKLLILLVISILFTTCSNKISNIIIENTNVSQLQMINAYHFDTKTTIDDINNLKIGVIDKSVDYSSQNLNIVNQDKSNSGLRSDTGTGYHGTAVVSLLSANKSELDDYQGLLPGAHIYFYEMENLDVESLVTCIDKAVEDNVDIINISLSTYKNSPSLKNSVQRAIDKDIIIIASAGNNSSDKLTYPSSYPDVISVGALDENYDLLSVSNFNDHTDVVAPGYTSKTLNSEELLNATSEATVYVTCLAILLKTKYPKYSVRQVKEKIIASSNSFTTYWNGTTHKVNLIDFRKTLDL